LCGGLKLKISEKISLLKFFWNRKVFEEIFFSRRRGGHHPFLAQISREDPKQRKGKKRAL